MIVKETKQAATPWLDPVVAEVRAVRDQHAAEFGFDARAIAESLKREQEEARASGASFVNRERKTQEERDERLKG